MLKYFNTKVFILQIYLISFCITNKLYIIYRQCLSRAMNDVDLAIMKIITTVLERQFVWQCQGEC